MSEAAQVPFTETKAPESADRLHRGALSLIDISASTMANIGPAYSFFFGFGFLVFTAGVAAPLTIIVAGVAIAFLGNTLAQFSRAHPSTGGFISFVGKTFGGTSAVTTAILCGAGYIIAISSVLAISGGFLATTLQHYLHWNVPWIILSVILTGGAVLMTIRGVGVSTKLAGFFFGFEMLVLIIVSIAALIKNGGHLSLIPFEPSHITKRLQRAWRPVSRWRSTSSSAGRTRPRWPRRPATRAATCRGQCSCPPRSWSSATSCSPTRPCPGSATTSPRSAIRTSIPFITLAQGILASFAFFAYLAGLTSTLGVLISAINSQARLIFNAGREGLLPSWIGRVHPVRKTPVNALFAFTGIAGLIILVWALLHLLGGHANSGSMNPETFFVESSTLGTILILVVYFLANLALPFYYRRYLPDQFNVVKHVVLPILGMIAIAVPVYYLVKPGQPAPYNWFPYLALGIVVVSIVYAYILNRRDPTLGERAGSIIADE